MEIRLPHHEWWPRPHQMPLWLHLRGGGKRAMAVWHRRAGKDEVCLHHTAMAMQERPGTYWHMLPQYAQARKSVFEAINPHTGRRRIDEVFPHELRESTRESDMFIRMRCAAGGGSSTWQCIGSDEYDRVVGSSAAGCVFSEWALSNPSAWGYMKPMLEENDGWAVFITTPRGRNHAFEMAKYAQRSSDWFYELLTARDTEALTEAQLDKALEEYRSLYGYDWGTSTFEQEMYCSWSASQLGSFYAHEMTDVRNEGRITECDPEDQPVSRAWDLGVGDDTSIWWFSPQPSGQIVVLDHLAASGHGVEWYRDEIFRRHAARGWQHGSDLVPHDAKVREFGSGRTRVETMASMGLKPILVPLATLDDGINAVRRTLPLCVFHPRTEEGGVSALEQYRREWDDDAKCFKRTPLHDWSSNPADAFRYLSQGWRSLPRREVKPPPMEGWRIPPPPERRRGGIVL